MLNLGSGLNLFWMILSVDGWFAPGSLQCGGNIEVDPTGCILRFNLPTFGWLEFRGGFFGSLHSFCIFMGLTIPMIHV